MSRFSPALKALIDLPKARQAVLPASSTIQQVYTSIAEDALRHNVSPHTWLALSAAATVTLNSPESLRLLHQVASTTSRANPSPLSPTHAADLIREVGLKCISFSGIPRTILSLTAISDLPTSFSSTAPSAGTPTRSWRASDAVTSTTSRGQALWSSIYAPSHLANRLTDKLRKAHPNLPVVIQESHYGALLADPLGVSAAMKVGRALTSIVAVASLRAQGGVGVQVTSHVRGLANAIEQTKEEVVEEDTGLIKGLEVTKEEVPGVRWLASDDGAIWLLESVDRVVESLTSQEGERFGRNLMRKLGSLKF